MNVDDEAIILAIKRMNDPDLEPERVDSDPETESDVEEIAKPTYEDPDMERLYQDSALRQHLGIGSSFTGPKGVKEDFKFHQKLEILRKREKEQKEFGKLSKQALSAGWLQRQIQAEEEDPDEKFLKEYREKRLRELQQQQPRFGSVLELTRNTFVQTIERENTNVKVVIHMYENSNQACRLVNDFLVQLAIKYPTTKFCKIVASNADASFDQIALPAILVYQGGDLSHTLLRLTDEIPDWADTGRCTLLDFEEYLVIQEVLDQRHRVEREDVDVSDDDFLD